MKCSQCGGEHQNEGGKYPTCAPPIQLVTLDKSKPDQTRTGLAGRPTPFFPRDMQLAPKTVDKLQDAAGFGFDDRLYYRLATAI